MTYIIAHVFDSSWYIIFLIQAITTEVHVCVRTFIVGACAVGEQIVAAERDAVAMKVVRLKEARPEFLLAQLVGNELGVTLLH